MTPGVPAGAEALDAVLASPMTQSMPLRVLTAFVAINTVIYSVLAVAKLLPRVYPSTWFRGRNRRVEDRSIDPAGAAAREPDGPGRAASGPPLR
ncbi:hypothetical protein Cfla_0378 [Cellulomonas flavigena DSM 20109]|uniref:Uncharacterized protein n=1 Tax=Cellulomonas flavigena (strain ATCC 482 / DSM 20109 / BCRC 11376 / JCM 18109 / NBRC 3775 / NCIMB 8073 / NRS 134) TaxID=446466 RepID=D5UH92_CELFN|nr:hypothetical protein [Cellulomonas flavigena]ADG73295.1 hypothetical protein Cfla_0378 [Cellulomonas flavigena DSM 20109]